MLPVSLLAAALLSTEDPSPTPPALAWSGPSKGSGQPALDAFAVRAVDTVVQADWKAFARLSGRKVTFETYEKAADTPAQSSVVLFDDAPAPADTPVVELTSKRMVVDTARPVSSFAKDQFSYFSALVRESVSKRDTFPKFSGSLASPTGDTRSPTIWGQIAPNATWRIVLGRSGPNFQVQRLVIEYH